MENARQEERKYSDLISQLRYANNIDGAILKCKEASSMFPNNNFFYKVLGDLYLQENDFINAINAYIEHLKRLHERPDQFNGFARSYRYFEGKAPDNILRNFNSAIAMSVNLGEFQEEISAKLTAFLGDKIITDPQTIELLEYTNSDANLNRVKVIIEKYINEKNLAIVFAAIDYRIMARENAKSRLTDAYFVKISEQLELYDKALALIEKNPLSLSNPTAVRTMLRICRKLGDYSFAERKLKLDEKFIDKSDFNIQYELVYYYEHIKNETLLGRTLKKMKVSATRSTPISRTLYNFYLRFNMFDEAKAVSDHIKELSEEKWNTKERLYEQIESEQGIWSKLQELVSDQEHNRQMIALRDLLKGFSHELGQPITNIRYSIQLHQMKMQKGICTTDINTLLDSVLAQTERIGRLLERFRPIVSSKSKETWFSIFDRVTLVFTDITPRLNAQKISYAISGDKKVDLWGDAVQFDQVFYNLILNSIQAFATKKTGGEICVSIRRLNSGKVKIEFSDTGPGVPEQISKKIFEPFFSTKDPSAEAGGEGLGLFIVWNILKMFNGKISLDRSYKTGAKFDIIILT